MTTKQWTLIGLAVLLGGVSLYLNRDWFATDNIQIIHRSRPSRAGFFSRKRTETPATDPVFFGLDRRLKLTALKVVAVSDVATNKYPHALWSLVSDSNSVPVKSFYYGAYLAGMRPEYKGKAPEPLQPGIQYRLLLEAGAQKAEHDFVPVPRS